MHRKIAFSMVNNFSTAPPYSCGVERVKMHFEPVIENSSKSSITRIKFLIITTRFSENHSGFLRQKSLY